MAELDDDSAAPSPDRRVRRRVGEAFENRDDDEGEGEDLLGEDMADDYREMGMLDQYDEQLLDDRDYRPLNIDERFEAERKMQERDRKERRAGAFGMSESDGEDETGSDIMMKSRRRVIREQGATAEDEADQPFVLEQYAGMSLREWVSQNKVRAEIKRRFKLFLQSPSRDDAEQAHQKAIDRMCSENLQSLEISYTSLSIFAPTLAIWLADVPKIMLEIFNEGSKEVVNEYYPDYNTIHDEIYVRITNLPVLDKLRDLRQMHLNVLVRLGGVVVRRSGVNPQMKIVRFRCRCGNNTQPFVIHNNEMPHVGICPECQNNGPYEIINEQTVYRNYQRLSLQESPGTVPPGRVPRQKEVILLADLVDSARPGEEIEVTGIYVNTFSAVTNVRNGFPVFNTSIEANYVMRKSDPSAGRNITEENRRQFEELKRDPRIIRRVIRSIAPSIYGNEHVKLGVALAMFGGSEKNVNQKHRIRGDINVLVLGDPGTAKSQVLKYVEKTAPRCVYTTGKGASAVGLTAAVHKDPLTGEWVLEGGALVLADRGVCCIDEFDKMTDQDRTSIHEAMEQQSISISKAGIVTSLQARCAVIAAANPIGGRYDPSKTFSENVQLTDPILTRFDVLCVLRDEVDPVADERLATFVVQSHFRSHPKRIADEKIRQEALLNAAAESGSGSGTGGAPVGNTTEDSTFAAPAADGDDAILPIPQDLLRKYILYARDLKPTLTNIDQGKVVRLYTDLRKESEISNGVPVAVRHIESIMRISEAVCRMRLGTVVSDSDLNTAMKVMLESFITAQKHATQRPLRRQFARYLQIDDNYNTLLLVMLKELRVLVQEQAVEESLSSNSEASADEIKVKLSKLVERARRHGITDLSSFLDNSASLRKQGYIYDRTNEVLIYKHGSFLDATLA